MMILSTEKTAIISKSSIKKLLEHKKNIVLTDKAMDEVIKLLEKKAKNISRYAVNRAKKKNRAMILKEDIESYAIECGE